MSDGVAMRKLEYTGASHYFSLPQRPPLPLFCPFQVFFPLAFLGFSVFFQDLFHPLVTT